MKKLIGTLLVAGLLTAVSAYADEDKYEQIRYFTQQACEMADALQYSRMRLKGEGDHYENTGFAHRDLETYSWVVKKQEKALVTAMAALKKLGVKKPDCPN